MRTPLLVYATMLLMLIFVGCSKSPEEASIDTLDEISEVLDSVQSKEDAQRVKGKLGELFAELEDYGKQLGDKGAEFLNTDTGKEFFERTFEVIGKIGQLPPEAADVLKEEFKRFRRR